MREKVILVCSDCLGRNYTTTKNKQVQKTRLEVVKFCPRCAKHTLHKKVNRRFTYGHQGKEYTKTK